MISKLCLIWLILDQLKHCMIEQPLANDRMCEFNIKSCKCQKKCQDHESKRKTLFCPCWPHLNMIQINSDLSICFSFFQSLSMLSTSSLGSCECGCALFPRHMSPVVTVVGWQDMPVWSFVLSAQPVCGNVFTGSHHNLAMQALKDISNANITLDLIELIQYFDIVFPCKIFLSYFKVNPSVRGSLSTNHDVTLSFHFSLSAFFCFVQAFTFLQK